MKYKNYNKLLMRKNNKNNKELIQVYFLELGFLIVGNH
jgi:hypothetical protein